MYSIEYVAIFLTLCVMEGAVWLSLWCMFYFEAREKMRGG